MRYLWHHIKTITDTYDGSVPLTHYLKHYCKQHPKLGSRDRRMLSAIIYSWCRCSKGIKNDVDLSFEQRVRSCLSLCGADMSVYEKLFADIPPAEDTILDEDALFPYDIPLSEGIARTAWLRSMLVQPQLFIRLRKDSAATERTLAAAGIPFTHVGPNCLALPNGAPVDTLLPADAYVVQDASSQLTGSYFTPKKGERWYDCCSGAGGKSLLLMDMGVPVALTVSDKRESILRNLKERFRLYGHKLPAAHIADMIDAKNIPLVTKDGSFDNIICDVPCSGSGTWARTPESMYFFDPGAVADYSRRQLAIATNVSRCLRPGGRLIYITCSVFRQENEDVVGSVCRDTGLQLAEQHLINGISQRADSMFIAVLQYVK